MSKYMEAAIAQAQMAADRGEVPVGCVIVHENRIIVEAGNETREHSDPTAHAELIAIRKATQLISSERLVDCDLYVTLEPCAMCAAAISFSRIRRLYYGASDPKGGGVENGVRYYSDPTCHHQPEIYPGMAESQCSELLKRFFSKLR